MVALEWGIPIIGSGTGFFLFCYKIALELLPKAVVKTIDFSRIKVTTIQTFNKSYICISFFSIYIGREIWVINFSDRLVLPVFFLDPVRHGIFAVRNVIVKVGFR